MRFRKCLAMTLTIISVLLTGCSGGNEEVSSTKEENLEFFKSLDFDDGTSVVVDIFERFPLQYEDLPTQRYTLTNKYDEVESK